ncbi:MAG TPA: M1 family aminopeptidase [Vicinamibacterales bacterium]|nr:M1 family aminopeptidase [Vicinamibacterales bacterium]
MLTSGSSSIAQVPQDPDSIRAFILRLQAIVLAGDRGGYLNLTSDDADRQRAGEFASLEIRSGSTKVVILERDREPLNDAQGTFTRVIVDTFVEFGARGRVATWQLDLRRTPSNDWRISNQQRLASVDNLYRLSLNNSRQLTARDFKVQAEDFELTLERGSVFTVDTDQGATALVLIGRGTMKFHPRPAVEQRQIEIFSGSTTLDTRFEAAYLRFGRLTSHADLGDLTERPTVGADFEAANRVFLDESGKSFSFDLSEFTSDVWTLLPAAGDFLAEVRTPRYGTLTYSHAGSLPEDISFFDRVRLKNISVYSSEATLARRGRFFNEDDFAEFDVRDYDLDIDFDPQRHWIDGIAKIRITTGTTPTNQLRLRLAPSLVVQSVTSDQFGRLFSVRVRNQDTLLVTLPALLLPSTDIEITVTYGGPLASQPPDWETMVAGSPEALQRVQAPPLPRDLYSSLLFWYPRPSITDYATATMRIRVPEIFECIASGQRSPDSPRPMADPRGGTESLYVFNAARPLRYLSFFVTRSSPVAQTTMDSMPIDVVAHPTLIPRARDLAGRIPDILRYFQTTIGEAPYSSFTMAFIEGPQPGGHSPGYFSIISVPPADSPRFWRNDPAAFDTYSEFFPAHEIAHQWWGQAVGWNTYHDQWLSEGFAQYFAALYVGSQSGDEAFREILANVREWAMRESDQGPVFLGYRLGHVKSDSRVFRALVYDKGAIVLHMLREMIGDDAFFAGIRQFYADWRFKKATTEDFRRVMESASGRSLARFFDRWIYGSSLPKLNFSYRTEETRDSAPGREVVLTVEQTGDVFFDVPVVVELQYRDRPTTVVTIRATEQTNELRVPLTGNLRRVEVRTESTLADIR